MSRVREFYAGQNVFITGVTGFLGKVLLEKLLRDCHEIENIFILIRAKKGKNIQERIQELLETAGVHVSTAYSHCVRDMIGEELYPPPLSYEAINKLVETTLKKESSEDARNDLTNKVLGKWPNTYTFTKAIGESVVGEFAKELPFAIFRPSVVVNTYNEPVKGWLPGPTGYPGVICGIGLGQSTISKVKGCSKNFN